MRVLRYIIAFIMPAVVVALVGFATPAAAKDGPDKGRVLPPTTAIQQDFDPSGTIVFSADTPSSVSAEVQAASASCGPFSAYGWPGGAWGPIATWINCSFIGMTSSSLKGYWWRVNSGSDSQGCAQAFGYNNMTPYWAGAGCGVDGSASLKWGNVAGVPKFKVRTITLTGVPVVWK